MNVLRPLCLALVAPLAATAVAQQSTPTTSSPVSQTIKFQIDSLPIAQALHEFGEQTGLSVVFQSTVAQGLMSPRLYGEFTPAGALERLLAHTGLHYEYLDAKTIAVLGSPGKSTAARKTNAEVAAPAGASGPALDSSSTVLRLAQRDSQASDVVSDSAASDSPGDKGDRSHVPEILVKGSRVFNVDVKRTEDDEQPYHILDSKQIQESGAVNVEDFLKQRLPMNTSLQSSSQSNNSQRGNNSEINLRGLGANETLVLIDGRRSAGVAFGGVNAQPNLNSIPLAAIERIEVLPSSASAIYGGAAMGGVVNIILKKNFQGGEIAYSYENTFEGHAPIDTVSATYGLTLEGGKTHVTLSGQYSDATLLRLRDRPELIAQGYGTLVARDPVFFSQGGATRPYLGATPNIISADGKTGLTFKGSGTALGSPIATIAPGASVADSSTVIPGRWNGVPAPTTQQYGSLQPLGSAPTIKSLMASIHRDFGSHLGFFADFSTQSDSTTSDNDPIFSAYNVPASSPANPFNQSVKISIPNTANAPYITNSVTHSVTVGMLARLPADWSAELDYTWSENDFSDSYSSDYDTTAFTAALNKGTINPFRDTLAHPIDLTSYLGNTSVDNTSTLNDLGLRVSGLLWQLPAGRPALTIGLEHRKDGNNNSDSYTTYPLTPSQNAHLRYFGQSQSTNSVYAEAQVPLVAPANPVPLVNSVDLQLAGRSERYAVNARTPFVKLGPDGSVLSGSPPQGVFHEINYTATNPTVGLKYKPIEDLAFRASFAKAFLPPTAQQFLPNPRNSGATFITDPANGQNYSVSDIQGGNPDLRPQTARNWNFGVIVEPQASVLAGLRINLEYYRLAQLDYITRPSTQELLANPAYASRVTRDPATGLVTEINRAYLNATQFNTAGWDLTIDYHKSTAVGTFDLHATGSAIDYDKRKYTISGPMLDYAGFPAELGEPKLKGNATLSWSYRAWSLAWTTSYLGSYKQGYGPPDSPYALQYGAYFQYTDAQGGYSIPSQTYHDIVASYDIGKTPLSFVSGLKIQLGVKNLFNKIPPLDTYYQPYLYSPYGDPRLRDYWLRVSARF